MKLKRCWDTKEKVENCGFWLAWLENRKRVGFKVFFQGINEEWRTYCDKKGLKVDLVRAGVELH